MMTSTVFRDLSTLSFRSEARIPKGSSVEISNETKRRATKTKKGKRSTKTTVKKKAAESDGGSELDDLDDDIHEVRPVFFFAQSQSSKIKSLSFLLHFQKFLSERQTRLDYFKQLESYEVAKEYVYII